ncbi:MAG: biotin-dependent carboxyltransferase family protein [Mycobacteriaceae bacterium]
MNFLEVIHSGCLTTFQDEGRPGHAGIGVSASGAADQISYAAGNRLLGNLSGTVSLEITFGGFQARAHGNIMLAITGAPAPILVNSYPAPDYSIIYLKKSDMISIGRPTLGVRSYLSVRGGFEAQRFLGSASTDTLSALGPFSINSGDLLRIGNSHSHWPLVDQLPMRLEIANPATLYITFGPRQDRFTHQSRELLVSQTWTVTEHSNRIGVRLHGQRSLKYRIHTEMLSEGIAHGSIQIPPSGMPILFLADHPVTGGYPVIAVITAQDIAKVAQLPPGHQIRFKTNG